jgi:hypothetical protein
MTTTNTPKKKIKRKPYNSKYSNLTKEERYAIKLKYMREYMAHRFYGK